MESIESLAIIGLGFHMTDLYVTMASGITLCIAIPSALIPSLPEIQYRSESDPLQKVKHQMIPTKSFQSIFFFRTFERFFYWFFFFFFCRNANYLIWYRLIKKKQKNWYYVMSKIFSGRKPVYFDEFNSHSKYYFNI